MNPELRDGRECGETIQAFEITICPRDTAIRTNMHVYVKAVPELVPTLRAEKLRLASVHLEHVFFEVGTDLKTSPANWTKALHQLWMVACHVLLEIVLRGEAHPTGLALETNSK